MVSTVYSDVESACELLWWVYERLESDVWHLKGFGKSIGLWIEHLESCMYHVLFQFALDDFDCAGCVVLCAQSLAFFHRFRSLGQLSSNIIHQLLRLLLHLLLDLLFEPSSSYFADLVPNLIFSGIIIEDFKLIEFINIGRDHLTTQDDHVNSLQLPGFDLCLQELLLLFSDLRMHFWTCLFLISLTDFHFVLDVLLQSKFNWIEISRDILPHILANVAEGKVKAFVISAGNTSHEWHILLECLHIDKVGHIYATDKIELRRIKYFLIYDWLSCFEEAIIFLVQACGI